MLFDWLSWPSLQYAAFVQNVVGRITGTGGKFIKFAELALMVQIRARVGTTGADPSLLLFQHKTPVVEANRADINNCPKDRTTQAKDLSMKKEHTAMPSKQCMIDV